MGPALAVAADLDRLLERRAVDPVDQRLRDGAQGPHSDGVEALLAAGAAGVVAHLVVPVQLRRTVVRERLLERALEQPRAAPPLAAAAIDARVAAAHLAAEDGPQVLRRVAPPTVLVGRAEVVAVVVGRVVERQQPLDAAVQPRPEPRPELRPDPARPPRVEDADRLRVLVRAAAVAVAPVGAGPLPGAQL